MGWNVAELLICRPFPLTKEGVGLADRDYDNFITRSGAKIFRVVALGLGEVSLWFARALTIAATEHDISLSFRGDIMSAVRDDEGVYFPVTLICKDNFDKEASLGGQIELVAAGIFAVIFDLLLDCARAERYFFSEKSKDFIVTPNDDIVSLGKCNLKGAARSAVSSVRDTCNSAVNSVCSAFRREK
jgi:hypothetical protein